MKNRQNKAMVDLAFKTTAKTVDYEEAGNLIVTFEKDGRIHFCPLCKSIPMVTKTEQPATEQRKVRIRYNVRCYNCNVTPKHSLIRRTKDEAIRAWNAYCISFIYSRKHR